MSLVHHRKIMLEVTGTTEEDFPRIAYWGRDSARVKRFRVIAVKGAVEDWAAYAGPENWLAADVQEHGMKLSPDVAAGIFPVLDANRYRP